MKRSFYEMLGIAHDANQSQIDAAYGLVTAKLNATTNLRGVAEAVAEAQLIRDGYQILSNPEKRARYDAKLRADETGIKLIFMPEDSSARRKLGVQSVVLAGLAATLGAILYHQLSVKMDEVRVEHVQAVARQKDEQPKMVVIDTIQSPPAVALQKDEPPKTVVIDTIQSPPAVADATNETQKR